MSNPSLLDPQSCVDVSQKAPPFLDLFQANPLGPMLVPISEDHDIMKQAYLRPDTLPGYLNAVPTLRALWEGRYSSPPSVEEGEGLYPFTETVDIHAHGLLTGRPLVKVRTVIPASNGIKWNLSHTAYQTAQGPFRDVYVMIAPFEATLRNFHLNPTFGLDALHKLDQIFRGLSLARDHQLYSDLAGHYNGRLIYNDAIGSHYVQGMTMPNRKKRLIPDFNNEYPCLRLFRADADSGRVTVVFTSFGTGLTPMELNFWAFIHREMETFFREAPNLGIKRAIEMIETKGH